MADAHKTRKPVLLCILDGWGDSAKKEYNAVAQAQTPNFDRLWSNFPHTELRTDGLAVGLPEGQFGNSEVGHTNIGAGRVVMQELPRITLACRDGSIAKNPILQSFIAGLKQSGGACHLMGLVSDGGVHSHQDHIAALAKILNDAGVTVYVHAFTDGRDTPPNSAAGYVDTFIKAIPANVNIATVTGRFYAMDRDNRWERVSAAWKAIVRADGDKYATAAAAIDANYAEKVTDEFIKPSVIGGYQGIGPNDGVLMANFRSDRVREILKAFLFKDFDGFDRGDFKAVTQALGMTEYADYLNPFIKTLFPPVSLDNIFGEVVSKAGLKQLRAAETEKYPHVTFFFNGGREESFAGEDRLLVASPKVATYDLKPEMSAFELTDELLKRIPDNDVIILNFANPDMVGHTGSLPAAIAAVEAVDKCLGKIVTKIDELGGVILVTADHGNAEKMYDEETHQPYTAHTTNPVPFIIAGYGNEPLRTGGVLADIAPTMLQILGVAQPSSMTGKSLIVKGGD